MALRESQARPYTERDTPIFTCLRKEIRSAWRTWGNGHPLYRPGPSLSPAAGYLNSNNVQPVVFLVMHRRGIVAQQAQGDGVSLPAFQPSSSSFR